MAVHWKSARHRERSASAHAGRRPIRGQGPVMKWHTADE